MKTLRVGIASYDEIKERTLAITKGSYLPKKNEPKVWFSSIESLAQVLSSKNKLLLEIIKQEEPQSIKELAELTGRQKSNLSRTLKTMQRYKLVVLKPSNTGKELIPIVNYDQVKLNFELISAHT
jgi:predicted transcriptional regulator